MSTHTRHGAAWRIAALVMIVGTLTRSAGWPAPVQTPGRATRTRSEIRELTLARHRPPVESGGLPVRGLYSS